MNDLLNEIRKWESERDKTKSEYRKRDIDKHIKRLKIQYRRDKKCRNSV